MSKITNIMFCYNCYNKTPQTLLHTHDFKDGGFYQSGERSEFTWQTRYFITLCESCNVISIYYASDEIYLPENFNKAKILFPHQRINLFLLPDTVRKCYTEALSVKGANPNAFAVLIRKSLEAICDNQGIKGNNLFSKLSNLIQIKEFPDSLNEISSLLRRLGNIGAHNSSLDVKPGYVFIIDELFSYIVEYLYIQPNKITLMKKHLENM